MQVFNCFFQTISKFAIGVIFLLFGMGAIISGFTLLPMFGFLLAVPLFYLAWYFIHVHLNGQCEISTG